MDAAPNHEHPDEGDEGGEGYPGEEISPHPSEDSASGPAKPRPPHRTLGVMSWTWSVGRGGSRVGPRNRCPVCGGDSNCQISAEGVVLCRRTGLAPLDGDGHDACGLYDREKKRWRPLELGDGLSMRPAAKPCDGGEGRLWTPYNAAGEPVRPREATPEENALDHARDANDRRAKIELAMRMFFEISGGDLKNEGPDVDHAAVRAYLTGRGIDLDRLPGGRLYRTLRYFSAAPRWFGSNPREWPEDSKAESRTWFAADETAPAMLACVVREPRADDGGGESVMQGVHATYLATLTDGRVVKHPGIAGGRRMLGPCQGNVYLTPRGEPPADAVIVVGEGIETTLAGLSLLGEPGGKNGAGAIAALNADLLKELVLPSPWLGMQADGRPGVHTGIVLGDLDKLVWKRGGPGRTGQRKARAAVERLRKEYPWITWEARFPTAKHFPELVKWVDGAGAVAGGEDAPIDADRGVDWDDVLKLEGDRGALYARGLAALTEGIDFSANRDRAARVLAARAAGDPGEGGEAVESTDGVRGGDGGGDEGDTRRGEGFKGRGGGGGAGGAGGGGGGGGGAGAGGVGGGGFEADDEHLLPVGDHAIAVMFLRQNFAPSEEISARKGRVYDLVHVGEKYYRWNGSVWVPLEDGKGDVVPIRGQVRRWLATKYLLKTAKKKKGELEAASYEAPIVPTDSMVGDVCRAVRDEIHIGVPPERTRFWLEPTFGLDGYPITGRRSWARWVDRPERKRPALAPPNDLRVMANGMLDMAAWERGELRWHAPDSRLFNEKAVEYAFPLAEVRKAWKDGSGESALAALAAKLCPNWHRFLEGVFLADQDPEGAAEHIVELQKLLWYWCTKSIAAKEGNFAILFGPGNAGKGTVTDVAKLVVGKGNYAMSTFEEFTDKRHITSWLGRDLVIVPEGEMSDKVEKKKALNVTKRVTGGDGMAVRKLYQEEFPDADFTCKFCVTPNELPDLRDGSGQFSNRVVILEFKRSHTDQPTYDPGLKARVAVEAAAGGVFVWAMLGGLEIGRRRSMGERVFKQPAGSAAAVHVFGQTQSNLPDFVADCLVVVEAAEGARAFITTDTLHRAYVGWSHKQGDLHPERKTKAVFSRELLGHLRVAGWTGRTVERTPVGAPAGSKKIAHYQGLRLSAIGQEMLDVKQWRASGPDSAAALDWPT